MIAYSQVEQATGPAWLEANNRYLADSLHWLRLRLQQLAGDPSAPAASTALVLSAPATSKRSSWFGKRSQPPEPSADKREPRPQPSAAISERLAQAAAAREASALCTPAPALLLLAERFGLSPFERDTLFCCVAAELDPGVGALFAAAQPQTGRSAPSFALAFQAFADPSWDALAPHRPLRAERLVELSADGGAPLAACALHADERVVNFVKGLGGIDDRLAQLFTLESAATARRLSDSQLALANELLERMRAAARSTAAIPHVHLLGPDPASKHAVAQHVCSAFDMTLYRVTIETLLDQRAALDDLARLWRRERALSPLALYLDAEAADLSTPEVASVVRGFIARESGVLFIGLRDAPAQASERAISVEVVKPTLSEQNAYWCAALREHAASESEGSAGAQLLAGQFNLNLDQIEYVAGALASDGGAGSRVERAWDACRNLTRPRLDALAQRLETQVTWDDLVLSDESLKLLQQIAMQVRGRFQVYERWGYGKRTTRGQGITSLFAGESGTGKTLAAEVIANELRLSLYRIDLSAVVSKYIGETEKNLRRLFDAAEHGGAILFFDEADALFGKRSEVKDSHDRYANIEINYLLQRMEAFRGLAILATNLKSALDSAFMRRLRFVVNFGFPGATERQQMWRKAFPAELPRDTLDYERLSRFNLSGGNIHSIALNAAFMAAERNGAVTQGLLLSAIRAELRKLDKPFNEAEFR